MSARYYAIMPWGRTRLHVDTDEEALELAHQNDPRLPENMAIRAIIKEVSETIYERHQEIPPGEGRDSPPLGKPVGWRTLGSL